ncbi:VTT domain-containing protein [Thermovenabulum gondwanense]|uniref:Phosphatidic acid phosphatase type 2/haloperoxidase domain-containing protein n=1 Tax=Thermovenabulum gondwanense TaxID=520767 RepID=A0A161PZ70_9FIRM|nr:VTT domain-containing protein [Thermovenabulum gondwanense]KYO68049.1 hypothetical protein ATZ99_03600 [Thermovenabulum gondwanense]
MFFMQNSALWLFLISFIEASFFPVPPDLVLIPLCLKHTEKYLFYAFIASIASAMGGLFGYFLGVRAGRSLLNKFINNSRLKLIEDYFKKYGAWAVAIAGFTPIPYKVFTIASGIFRMDIFTFFIASFFSRGARFFLEALIVRFFGEKAELLINKYLGPGSFALIGIIFVVYYIILKSSFFVRAKIWILPFYKKIKFAVSLFLEKFGEFGVYVIAGVSYSSVAALVFLKIVDGLKEKELDLIDGAIVKFILSHFKTPLMDIITGNFIEVVESPVTVITVFIISTGFVFYIYKKLIYLFLTFASFSGAVVIQLVLKNEIQRLRPVPEIPMGLFFKYGFPSGSVLVFTSFIGYAVFLTVKILDKKTKKYAIIFIDLLLTAFIGFCRVYNMLNYPSDVFAGFLIGGIWLSALIIITLAFENYFRIRRG